MFFIWNCKLFANIAKSWTWLSYFTFTFHFHALEKGMATHSSVLAWKIPGTGEPGGLPSMGSHRVGHDWSDVAAAAAAAAVLDNILRSKDANNECSVIFRLQGFFARFCQILFFPFSNSCYLQIPQLFLWYAH